jgi:hypothetical protein
MRITRIRIIIFSLVAVLAAMVAMGAAYTATECCTGTGQGGVHAQNIDLKIKDQDEPWRNGVSSTWKALNMAPGTEYAFEGSFIGLRTSDKSSIEVTCDYKVTEEVPGCEADSDKMTYRHPDNMAKQLILTRCIYKGNQWQIDCLTGQWDVVALYSWKSYHGTNTSDWKIKDSDNDGRITFFDLKEEALTNLPLPAASYSSSARFEISVKFAESARNDLQGDTLTMDMVYSVTPWESGTAIWGKNYKNIEKLLCSGCN